MTPDQRIAILNSWGFTVTIRKQPDGTFNMGYQPSFIKTEFNYETLTEGTEFIYHMVLDIVYFTAIDMGVDL